MKHFQLATIATVAALLTGHGMAQEKTEKTVAFRAATRYVSTVAQGGLDINGKEIGSRQTFILTDLNGADLADGDAVRIRWAPEGTRATYWQENNGFVVRTGNKPDDTCTFHVKFVNKEAKDGAFVLQTASGKFTGSGKNTRLVTVEEQASAVVLVIEEVKKPEDAEKTEKTPPAAPAMAPANATPPATAPTVVNPANRPPVTPVTNIAPLPDQKPTIWLIGDSTVNNGTPGQKGWGSVLGELFNGDKIAVQNRARGGRSSRTFLTEGLWDAVLKDVKPGDYVLMQFGHNDGGKPEGVYPNGRASLSGNGDNSREVETKPGQKEVVYSFGWYLRRYIAEAKAKGATPIVLSLIPRNDWKDGKVSRATGNYGGWAKEAAEAGGALFIDLNALVADKYDRMGQESVKPFFPNEHTHTNEAGARLNAQTVVEGLKSLPNSPFGAYLKAEVAP